MNEHNPNTKTVKDEQGRICQIDHSAEPFTVSENPAGSSPASLAARYIRTVFEIKNVRSKTLTKTAQARLKSTCEGMDELWLKEIKQMRNLSVVEYVQFAHLLDFF